MPRPTRPCRRTGTLARCPSCPRWRPSARSSRRDLEGERSRSVEILDPRLTRPFDLFEIVEELEGDRVEAVERRGKYLLLPPRERPRAPRPPAYDRQLPLRQPDESHERAVPVDDGTRLAYRDVRRFGTWLVLEGAELEPYLATKNGPEPLGPRFTSRWLAVATLPPAGAPQGRAPRPARRRRPGEHLRGRGALARAAQPAPCRRTRSSRTRCGGSGARSARRSLTGIQRQGSTLSHVCDSGRPQPAGCRRSFASTAARASRVRGAETPIAKTRVAAGERGTAAIAKRGTSGVRYELMTTLMAVAECSPVRPRDLARRGRARKLAPRRAGARGRGRRGAARLSGL